eukprot:Hpha_TRINITY_DN12474_c0_g1::TRINITY_DN12474_c0_g1_i1::g.42977::m.42977
MWEAERVDGEQLFPPLKGVHQPMPPPLERPHSPKDLLRAAMMSHNTLRRAGLRTGQAVVRMLALPAVPPHPTYHFDLARCLQSSPRFGPAAGSISGFTDKVNRGMKRDEGSPLPLLFPRPPGERLEEEAAEQGGGTRIFKSTEVIPPRKGGRRQHNYTGELPRDSTSLAVALQKQAQTLRKGEGWTLPLEGQDRRDKDKEKPDRAARRLVQEGAASSARHADAMTSPASRSLASQSGRSLARSIAQRIEFYRNCGQHEREEFQDKCEQWVEDRLGRRRTGNFMAANKGAVATYLPPLKLEALTDRAETKREQARSVRRAEAEESARRHAKLEIGLQCTAQKVAAAKTLSQQESSRLVMLQRWQPLCVQALAHAAWGQALRRSRRSLLAVVEIRARRAVGVIEEWWGEHLQVRKGRSKFGKIRVRHFLQRRTADWVKSAKSKATNRQHFLVTQFLRDFATSRRVVSAVHRFIYLMRKIQRGFRSYQLAKKARIELWTMQWMTMENKMRDNHLHAVRRDINRHRIGQTHVPAFQMPAAPMLTPSRENTISPPSLFLAPKSPPISPVQGPRSPVHTNMGASGRSPAASSLAQSRSISRSSAMVPRKPNAPVHVYKRVVGPPAVPLDVRDEVLDREHHDLVRRWAKLQIRYEAQMEVYLNDKETWEFSYRHFTQAQDHIGMQALMHSKPIPPSEPVRLQLVLHPEALRALIENTVRVVEKDIHNRIKERFAVAARVGTLASQLYYGVQSNPSNTDVRGLFSLSPAPPPRPVPTAGPLASPFQQPAAPKTLSPSDLPTGPQRTPLMQPGLPRASPVLTTASPEPNMLREPTSPVQSTDPMMSSGRRKSAMRRWPGAKRKSFEMHRTPRDEAPTTI